MSSADENADAAISSVDEEKQLDQPSTSTPPREDEFLVGWDGDNDPLNPRSLPVLRKWFIVIVVSLGSLLVTCASSIYASTYDQIMKEFHSSREVVTLGLSLFVVGLAVGPMALAPLSEFYGRRPVYIMSMFLFLIFLIPSAAAKDMQTMLVARFLNGVSGSAFLSVAAGTVADLFVPAQIQTPMMAYTLSPFLGPVLGPLIGGFVNSFTSWRWSFYILIIWSFLNLIALFFVPETFHPVLLARKAASLRKSTNTAYHSASELARVSRPLSVAFLQSLYRPFQLLLLEPMCLSLCIYTAFVLGILYLFFGAFPLIFSTNHGFVLWQNGLTFLGLMIGLVGALLTNPLWHKNYQRLIAKANANVPEEKRSQRPDPELRLPPAILGGILVPISLFWVGWTTYPSVHWIVPIIGSIFFGAATFFVFSGIWTFLVDAYPAYAASALAANTFVRCMFAGAFPLFGDQMYEKLGYQWATSLLAFIAVAMMPFPYLFFRYGKVLRARSSFAQR